MSLPTAIRMGALALLVHGALVAQDTPLTHADSVLVGRVLAAEDRRDASDAALATAIGHADVRVRVIANRALGRIRDPKFEARDSLPSVATPPTWPEPAWRLRYRALTPKSECSEVRPALADSAWPVRLRAAAIAGLRCQGDTAVVTTLRGWMDSLPANAAARSRTGHALSARAGRTSLHSDFGVSAR